MNAHTFFPSFVWICLTSVSTFGSCCCLALWNWRALSRPAITSWHLSHIGLPFVGESSHGVQVSRTSSISLFSGYGLRLSAASIRIWRCKQSPAFRRRSLQFSLQPQVVLPYLCTWTLLTALAGFFCGEAPVGLLCCCCPENTFFPELSCMSDF